jgi:hypothetical protein
LQWQADASYAIQVMAGYTLTAAQEGLGQEARLTDSGTPGEDESQGNGEGLGYEEGLGNGEDPPDEEEEGILGGDEEDRHTQAGTGTNGGFQGTYLWLNVLIL